MIIGIDLGTTNSLVSVWGEKGPQLIPNKLGEMLTPSCVSIDEDGSVLIGNAARDRLQTHPERSTALFKRYMGSERIVRIGKRDFRPEELSSLILRALKEDAEAYLGHPVTEAITGLDIVREQIRIAAGGALGMTQSDITFEGHAIECRINAENGFTFRPSPGTITQFHSPGGLGVRFDSAIYAGYRIPPYYDSLAGKLIVHARNRNECLLRLRRALDELVVGGIETTIPLFQKLVREPDIINGDYSIHWLEKYLAALGPQA